MNVQDTINEKMLLDGEEVLAEELKDPEFKEAFEASMLRLQVAQTFRERREQLKISQVQLAELAHTNRKAISRIENGITSVGVDLLHKVATALGTKVNITLA